MLVSETETERKDIQTDMWYVALGGFTHTMPCPFRSAKCLDCVFPIWFTQWGRVWFTHAMPFLCHSTNMPFWKRPLKATAGSRQGRGRWMAWERHGMCELASAVQRRHVGDLPAFGVWQGRGRGTPWKRHGICEFGIVFLQANTGTVPELELSLSRFLPNPFQFVIHSAFSCWWRCHHIAFSCCWRCHHIATDTDP
jgi:hypothetical protein